MVLGVAAVGITLANPSTSHAQNFGVHLDIGRTHIDVGNGVAYLPGYRPSYYPNYPRHDHCHPQTLVRHGNYYYEVPAYSPPVYVAPSYYSVPSYYRTPAYVPSGPRVIIR
jgi:hypothetical protein